MQISNKTQLSNVTTNEKQLELIKNETYNAQIKSRISETEAVIQIKGKDLNVKFEEAIPKENRVSVQISDIDGGEIKVKTITTKTPDLPSNSSSEKMIEDMSLSEKSKNELRMATSILEKKTTINKDTLVQLNAFLENETGTIEEKLVSLRALASKNLEVSAVNLRSIHTAINGEPLNDIITKIANAIDPNFQKNLSKNQVEHHNTVYDLKNAASSKQNNDLSKLISELSSAFETEEDIQKGIELLRTKLSENPQISKDQIKRITQAIQDSEKLQSIAKTKIMDVLTNIKTDDFTDVATELNKVKEQIKQEPNLQKAIETVKETIVNNPKMPPEVVKQVEQAVREATISQRLGQESAGREKLVQAITKAEQEVTAQQSKPVAIDQGKAVQDQLNQTKDQIKQEPNLQKAIETVKETIVNNPKMPQEVVKQVEQAVREASNLRMMGKEQLGLNKINQVLQQINESTKISDSTSTQQINEKVGQLINSIKNNLSIPNIVNEVKEMVNNNKSISPQQVKQLEQVINQADQLNVASKERIKTALNQVIDMDNSKIPNEKSQVQQNESNREAARANTTTHLQMDSIKQAAKQIQKEPILEKALNDLKSELGKNENLSPDKKEKIEKAINTSLELSSKGREMASRQNISKALQEVETAIQQENKNYVEDSSPKQVEMEEKRWDSQLQAMGISSKDILVTKISQKLAEATHEFRDIKREIYRNLDNAQKLMEKYKDSSIPQASKIIESTIAKLDQTILKSDLMLYADMRTEKRLLQASSQLAEAKKYLSNGNTAKATEIVSEVKKLVDSIQYKPSEQKIVHYVSKSSALLEEVSPLKSLVRQTEDIGRNYILEGEEPSSRQIYEKIRSLGLNRESDVANKLVSSHTPTKEQEDNLKTTLLKLASSENLGDETVSRQAEQALNNINGQQLLNKQDSSSQLQSMFFNLPMLLGEKNENIQVFINSKSKGEQVDWENCNLYFLLETKKLGDVGILLNATDRNLSITVKNDSADFEKKMSPLSKIAVDRLQEIGYQVQNIHFTHLTNPSADTIEKKDNKRLASVNDFIQEKGVNLQI